MKSDLNTKEAVLDIDSPEFGGVDELDVCVLEELAARIKGL